MQNFRDRCSERFATIGIVNDQDMLGCTAFVIQLQDAHVGSRSIRTSKRGESDSTSFESFFWTIRDEQGHPVSWQGPV
jgi:hypothetical protein